MPLNYRRPCHPVTRVRPRRRPLELTAKAARVNSRRHQEQ
jgi:hypothetical protein